MEEPLADWMDNLWRYADGTIRADGMGRAISEQGFRWFIRALIRKVEHEATTEG